MSSRYGRNQKRRHRAQVEELEARLAREAAAANAYASKSRELERRLLNAIEVKTRFERRPLDRIYTARVDMDGPTDNAVVEMRVDEMAVLDALRTPEANAALAMRVGQLIAEQIRYAR